MFLIYTTQHIFFAIMTESETSAKKKTFSCNTQFISHKTKESEKLKKDRSPVSNWKCIRFSIFPWKEISRIKRCPTQFFVWLTRQQQLLDYGQWKWIKKSKKKALGTCLLLFIHNRNSETLKNLFGSIVKVKVYWKYKLSTRNGKKIENVATILGGNHLCCIKI